MSLYGEWKEIAGKERNEKDNEAFWSSYFEKEKSNYEYILEKHNEVISASLSDLAGLFNMDRVKVVGFLDGINTSLIEELDLDKLEDASEIRLEVDFEKLYFNMLEAKADWLYSLSQWDEVLTQEKRIQITREFKQSKMAISSKIGRNDPCPCGSGKKYKKCCQKD